METLKNHDCIADMNLSGTRIRVGTYDSERSSKPSVWIQTDENPEPIYMKTSEAGVLISALMAATDLIEEGY